VDFFSRVSGGMNLEGIICRLFDDVGYLSGNLSLSRVRIHIFSPGGHGERNPSKELRSVTR